MCQMGKMNRTGIRAEEDEKDGGSRPVYAQYSSFESAMSFLHLRSISACT